MKTVPFSNNVNRHKYDLKNEKSEELMQFEKKIFVHPKVIVTKSFCRIKYIHFNFLIVLCSFSVLSSRTNSGDLGSHSRTLYY